MARRSDNTRSELKEMAIEAGTALLAEAGIAGLSARQIAQRIGYTVGTLYNVFSDFEDIVLHINAATLCDMQQQLMPLAHSRRNPQQRILALAHCYGAYAMANPARWQLLHHSARSTPLPEWFRKEVRAAFGLIEAPLLEILPKKHQVADAATVLWAGLHGICALGINHKLEGVDAAPMQALIDNFVTKYLKGYTR